MKAVARAVQGLIFLTLSGAIACWSPVLAAQPSRAQAGSALPPGAADTIRAANAAWVEAMRTRDAAAIAEPYADEAVFVTAGGEVVRGRSGVEALMRERFARSGPFRDVSLAQDGVAVAGELIYEWGHASYTAMSGPRPTPASGRYLTVWKKDSAGRWRIVRNLSLG